MSHWMDIVVGDFGRPGLLRYLEAFSNAEQALIEAALPPGAEFLDEHRRVQLTVLGQLRIIKREILEAYARDGRELDHGVMVGTSGGAPVESIVTTLGALLRDQLAVAAKYDVTRARVVIPCNTLGLIAEPLEAELRSTVGIDLAVEPMQRAVGAELRERGIDTVRVLGTPSSEAAYREALGTGPRSIAVPENPGELTAAYEQCINDSIRRAPPAVAALETVRAHTASRDAVVLEACTDVKLGLGLDALEIYAARLAREAYTR